MILLIVLVALPLVGTATPARAQNPCDGLVAPRLIVGQAARVISPYGLSMKNRAATGAAGSSEVALLSYGTVVAVEAGSSCNYGYIWWPVHTADGSTGWIAEGDASTYFAEPYTVGLHSFLRSGDGAQIAHYFVTPDGAAQLQGTFVVPPLSETPQQVWQQVEIDRLGVALETVKTGCPDRLAGTPLENATLETAVQLPLPTLDYEYYPSPDGTKLLLVRSEHLTLPHCTSTVPEKIGMSRVSVLDANGQETVLFPFPQHGTVPASEDSYQPGDPTPWTVWLSEVVWSPQGKYIAFVVTYQDLCQGGLCYRYHLYVANLDTGQLYITGEGEHVGWTNGGDGLNMFRIITEADGARRAHLYSMKPDGSNRQEIWLPGGAVYVSPTIKSLGFPWNEGGTRVMVGNAGLGEVMLFKLTDRSFTPPVVVPDLMPQENRLAIGLINGEKTFFWSTIRGEFVTQSANTGDWDKLNSSVATTGVAPLRVRTFPLVNKALIEMVDGTAYVLDIDADTLIPVGRAG
jgi:hypothetical protein